MNARMMADILQERKSDFEKALEHFSAEASKLRTGRAHPGLVEDISVDYYGTRTPLKQMATIGIPEARQITIQPWDRNAVGDIETALRASDLGLNPNNDGQLIRITLPALTEDTRRVLVKTLNQKAEESRISIRSTREEIWQAIQKTADAGDIGEDEKFRGKDDLQKSVDNYNERLEVLRKKKEDEIMTL